MRLALFPHGLRSGQPLRLAAPLPAASEAEETTAFEQLLDEGVLTPELLHEIVQAAEQLEIPDAPECDWAGILKKARTQGTLSPEDVVQIRDFTRAVDKEHRRVHRDFRDSDYKDAGLDDKLEKAHVYLQKVQAPRDSYRENTARMALEAAVGASFAPLATVAAYVAWADNSQQSVDKLLECLSALTSGTSSLVLGGNRARPVHQEKLWQAKMQMLGGAIAAAGRGEPPEIDAQYFELTSSRFVGKLAEAARAGCPVRINIDPSRPSGGGLSSVSVDDGPRKLRALLQMAQLKNVDVGISVYPVTRELGGLRELMHRKLLRVGDQVLLGGMNANEGSGENVDAGYIIEGPAARRLVEVFAQDVYRSTGAGVEDVYGDRTVEKFVEGEVSLTPHGLATLLDTTVGPSAAGTHIESHPTLERLQQLADEAGLDLADLLDVPRDRFEGVALEASLGRKPLPLTSQGKLVLAQMVNRTFDEIAEAENLEHLSRIDLPRGDAVGSTRVAVGSEPEEREALLLNAIATAEEFIYIPTFVITRPVARALAARKQEMAEKGRELDIRAVVDAGVYPFGGTPNEQGVMALEDAGIAVRWALLPRTSREHDRKIHAKQVVTDKLEFFGSTNLSSKGMQDNWELSGVVFFDPDNPAALESQEDGKTRFLRLWEEESISLDSRAAAEARLAEHRGRRDFEMRVEEARSSAIRALLYQIRNYENESADFIQEKAADPAVQERSREYKAQGMAEGYALLKAVEETMGSREFRRALRDLPTRRKLADFTAA